ncbi:MAG TPA: GNAT family N-acetyltransferase [Nocardioides sp.]|uniref:GNAT family N-acetyltransferase n=1 Tax=Nocardioides sp. TaxID=35761 RepID=UPI002BB54103|nr:GNAT family N-acetyltransferase [Nocardioides sp.]HQR27575.1 GNAT family N-acetyltransferase [Nocardioides sp.]
MVSLEFLTDPAEFLRRTADHLAADPVTATVVATVTARLADEDAAGVRRDPAVPRWWLVVTDDAGGIVGVAMRTAVGPPHALFLLPMPEEAALGLARALHARGEWTAGLNGALPATRVCAEEVAALWGGTVAVDLHTRLFELGELVPPRPAPGRLRRADTGDLELVVAWYGAFHADADAQAGRTPGTSADADPPDPEGLLRRIAAGEVWLWEDPSGRPVHLTGASRPQFGVARLGPVYTPAEHRGRGYGGATVAEVSRRLRRSGARVCLFTDQANPTSNSLYQTLGYRPVVDMVNLVVGRPS